MVDVTIFKNQIKNFFDEFDKELGDKEYWDYRNVKISQDRIEYYITKAITLVSRISGSKSDYSQRIKEILKQDSFSCYKLRLIIGSLRALDSDIKNNYLQNISQLLHAELFSDFLEMAEHLLKEGYKCPAAVIAGSTLEEHLRKLCSDNNIKINTIKKGKQIPKKADLLNSELVKARIYNKLDQKQITAWLDLRNKAAHGKNSEYSDDQVKYFISGLRDFLIRVLL